MKKQIRTFDFKTPFDPALIKTLKDYEISSFCNDIRNNLIENCAKNGGHLSSNLGVVELTVDLHKFFDLPKDKIIFDVGHQSYTHKLLSGRTLPATVPSSSRQTMSL
jgi:1-deoxy-D-xylulose-5-phosphate synthase